MFPDVGSPLIVLEQGHELEFLCLQIVFHLCNGVVVERAFKVDPHLFDLPSKLVLLLGALADLSTLAPFELCYLSFSLNSFLALVFDTLKLRLHLIDHQHQFRLQLLVDLDDATSLGVSTIS